MALGVWVYGTASNDDYDHAPDVTSCITSSEISSTLFFDND